MPSYAVPKEDKDVTAGPTKPQPMWPQHRYQRAALSSRNQCWNCWDEQQQLVLCHFAKRSCTSRKIAAETLQHSAETAFVFISFKPVRDLEHECVTPPLVGK